MDAALIVRRHLWSGRVPVAFSLAPNEITALVSPLPLYLMLPRMSYLPLFAAETREHFLSYAPAREDEVWFEAEGEPLRWQYPIGVLFDQHNGGGGGRGGGSEHALPWAVTVHFQGFPAHTLLRCKTVPVLHTFVLNAFKEACFLTFGSTRPAMSLTNAERARLWDSILRVDAALHAEVIARARAFAGLPPAQRAAEQPPPSPPLQPAAAPAAAAAAAAASSSSSSSSLAPDAPADSAAAPVPQPAATSSPRSSDAGAFVPLVPVRVLIGGETVQQPLRGDMTVGALLELAATSKAFAPSGPAAADDGDGDDSEAKAAAEPAQPQHARPGSALSAASSAVVAGPAPSDLVAVAHGIVVDRSATLRAVWDHMHYPDLWLYLVVRPRAPHDIV